jgi:hypothetical protein
MRKVAVIFGLMFGATGMAQVDSADHFPGSMPDEAILQHYLNEPEPPDFSKGPTVGDSVFFQLDPLTAPTVTVDAEPLSIHRLAKEEEEEAAAETGDEDTSQSAAQRLKPKISLGGGSLAYHGDLYGGKHFQSPVIGRPAADLAISHRITKYLQLDFAAMFGMLGANEKLINRNENFQSEIRAGGVNLLYDFGNFIPDIYTVRPFVSIGVMGFEFLSKTDLKDNFGRTYHYWSDGSIRDRSETGPGAQFAQEVVRDYRYESDIRELNRDGFGKYAERAWSVPVGFGAVMKITDRVDVKLNFQYFFTTTDYIDGVDNGEGARRGMKQNDNFAYTSFSIQYDLIGKFKRKKKTGADTLDSSFLLALENEDYDKDGVTDFKDECQGTEAGATVDEKGCPLDDDKDGIPNFRDDEPATLPGAPVNDKGVTQNDAYWEKWYAQYLNDTLPSDIETVVISNYYFEQGKKGKKKKKEGRDNYTVELVRYNGSIPSDELAFILSIGDITSTTLEDGTTVVYTSGNYDNLNTAIKRRNEFRTAGNKEAGISKIKGRDIVPLSEEELADLLKSELGELSNVSLEEGTESEQFDKNDIVYRVQLGAFKNRISTTVFNTSAGVLELKTGESVFRYVTKGYKTIEQAAAVRADLVVQGYSDAFVTAYQDGKRIPMSQTKATVEKDYKEDLSEDKIFSSVDKKLVSFKVQLGPLKKKTMEPMMDEKVKALSVQKQVTAAGTIRYMTGEYSTYDQAERYRRELEEKGFLDAFVIATFKGDIISLQEAMELMK